MNVIRKVKLPHDEFETRTGSPKTLCFSQLTFEIQYLVSQNVIPSNSRLRDAVPFGFTVQSSRPFLILAGNLQ